MTTTKTRTTRQRKTAAKKRATKGTGTSQGRVTQPMQPNRSNPIPIPFTQPEMDRVYAQIFALGFTHWESEYGAELLLCVKAGKTLEPSELNLLKRIHAANQAAKQECAA